MVYFTEQWNNLQTLTHILTKQEPCQTWSAPGWSILPMGGHKNQRAITKIL